MPRSASRKRPEPAGRGEAPNPTAVTLERVAALRQQWASGQPTHLLASFAIRQWGLSDRQARRLVQLLRAQVRAEVSATDRADRVAEVAEKFRELHRQAMVDRNFNAAASAINGLSRALGVPFMPQLEAVALQAVSAAFLDALQSSSLPQSEKTMVQLHLAARGLMPLPDLTRAPIEVLAEVAGDQLLSDAPAEIGQEVGCR